MKIKRLISVICAFAMLVAMLVPVGVSATTPDVTITVENQVVEYGEGTATVSVPIKLEGVVNLGSFQLEVAFDETISCTDFVVGDALAVSKPPTGKNPTKIAFTDMTGSGADTKTGTLATIVLSVPTNEVKKFPITLTLKQAKDGELNDVSSKIEVVSGEISVEVEPKAIITARNVNAILGEGTATVSVPIELEGVVNLGSFQLEVAFDETISCTDFVVGDALAVSKPPTGKNPTKIAFTDMTGSGADTRTGTLATIVLSVPVTEAKEFPITLTLKQAKDGELNDVSLYIKTVDGKISVIEKEPEDITAITEIEGQTYTYNGAVQAFDTTALEEDLEELGIEVTNVAYEPAEVKNVGTYAVAVTLGGAGWNEKIIDTTLTINKAKATSVVGTFDGTFAAGAADAAAVKAAMNLPATVNVNYGTDLVEENVTVSWAEATEEFNVKGGTYTYVATLTSDNLDFSEMAEVKATATVTPVTATFATPLTNVAVTKAAATTATTLAELGLPETIVLNYGDGQSTDALTIVWDKTIDDVKSAAENVAEGADQTVVLTVKDETFASVEYLTVTSEKTATVGITYKDPATITFDIAEKTVAYGTDFAFDAPTWAPVDGDVDTDATVKVTYKGRGETVYEESETAPTAVGTYTVTATLISDIYSAAPVTVEVEITPATLTGTIAIALADDVITATVTDAVDGSYDIKWFRGDEEIADAAGATYAVTAEDYGKSVSAKAVAKAPNYTGELVAEAVEVPAKAPSNIAITAVERTKDSITVEVTADKNGKDLTTVEIKKDNGGYEVIVADEDGKYIKSYPDLEKGTAYTFVARVTNGIGDPVVSDAVTINTKSSTSNSGGGSISSVTKLNGSNSNKDDEVTDTEDKDDTKDDNEGTTPVTPSHDCPSAAFTDVNTDAWYHENVDYVVENGLMNGVAEDTFAPNATLTRAMLVTVLYRAEGSPAVNRSIPFADIDLAAYYANAVIWAQQNGIVNGIDENTFAPNANITREQAAAIIYRYSIYKGMDAVDLSENLAFNDADEISEYAISALNWAVGQELVKGYEDNTVRPANSITRAEMSAILQRFLTK